MVYCELKLRNADFYTHSTDLNGRVTPIGINHLIKILRNNEHPNEESETPLLNEEQQQKFKYFNPIFLTASEWTPDNVEDTISKNCDPPIYKVDNTSALPRNCFLFSKIRKVHYDYVVEELTYLNVSYESHRISTNGKRTKTGIKELIKILRLAIYPNEEEESAMAHYSSTRTESEP